MESEKKKESINEWDQYRCPTGAEGREVAANMNKTHFDLTTWGLKHVRIEPSFVVLDVGCGGGKTLDRLSRRAFLGKVYGIDRSADMVDYSRQANKTLIKCDRVEVVEGSVEKTGFEDEFFDLVTAVETYYFWSNLSKAFQEIRRILKRNGSLLLVSEMVKDGVYEVKNAEIIAKTKVRLLALDEIQRILCSLGFSNIKVYKKRKSAWNAILAQKA